MKSEAIFYAGLKLRQMDFLTGYNSFWSWECIGAPLQNATFAEPKAT